MPHDDDDLLEQVMRQLGDALGDLDTHALRDAVKQGLDEALGALGQPPTPPRADGRPHVVVLDGGLSDDGDDDSPSEPPPTLADVQIEVVRGTDEGWLAPGDGGQTVYAGRLPATYRLAVTSGAIEVHADDQPVATVRAGQSSDVQGARIVAHGRGRGSYRPVADSSRST